MAARFVALLAVVASARAGIVGSPLVAPGLASPLGIAGVRTIGGLPLGVASPYGLGAPLGVASPVLAGRTISGLPLGVSSPLIAGSRTISGLPLAASPLGLASPLVAGARLASPLGIAAPLGVRVASPLAYAAAPIAKTVVPAAVDTDYDPNPSYSYAYDVQDALTGDSKNQQESRQGDVVQGSYSLTEPDGTRRTVEYTADPVNGFNAVVHRQPLAVAKTVVAAPTVLAAPALTRVASPLGLASPLTQTIIQG